MVSSFVMARTVASIRDVSMLQVQQRAARADVLIEDVREVEDKAELDRLLVPRAVEHRGVAGAAVLKGVLGDQIEALPEPLHPGERERDGSSTGDVRVTLV